MNWNELATTSHLQTAVAIGERLEAGDFDEVRRGVEELIEALSRAERRALRSQVIRLMAHVIKWKSQPVKRSASWAATINNARFEIRSLQEDEPSLTDEVIRQHWDHWFKQGYEEATVEMGFDPIIDAISWQDVFETKYRNEPPPRGK